MDSDKNYYQRLISRFVAIIYVTGLLLPAILGLIIRAILAAKGIEVVSLSQGLEWVIPLTLFFLVPFVLYGLATNFFLSKAVRGTLAELQKKSHICVGGFMGMSMSLGYLLIIILQSIEGIAHAVAFFPFLIIGIILWASGGILAGFILGWAVWKIRKNYVMN